MTGSRRRIRVDPHVHTGTSHDGQGSVYEVLSYCDDRGLDAVAITDHDTTTAANQALAAQHHYDVEVIPGAEISTSDGHLLALGIETDPPVGRPFAETVTWIRDHGGLAVVPHPFQRSRHGVGRAAITTCDGVEVFNAWAITGVRNRRAAAFARREGYPGIGSSDAHRPDLVGTAHTEVVIDAPLSVETILEAIAAGRCWPAGRSARTSEYLRKSVDNVTRWTRSARGLDRLSRHFRTDR